MCDTCVALQVIISLLEQYGQGGNCAEYFSFTYHNSFLIADRKEAWVLETAVKYWVAERVTQGPRSLSHNLSIRSAGDLCHANVIRDAVAKDDAEVKQNSILPNSSQMVESKIACPLTPGKDE